MEFLLHVGSGIIIWYFLVSSVNEGATALIDSATLIKQVKLSPTVPTIRVVVKNLLLLFHNMLLLVPLLAFNGEFVGLWLLFALPALLLVVGNFCWIAIALSLLSARLRDLPAIANGVLMIAFYVTPILWSAERFEGTGFGQILLLNPFFHVIEVFRQPVFGEPPSTASIVFLSVSMAIGWLLTRKLLDTFGHRVPYWV